MMYITIGLVILFLAIKFNGTSFTPQQQKIFNFLLLIIILIPALRYRVGGDTLDYMKEYETMPTLSELKSFVFFEDSRYQPLWILFVATLKSITPSFVLLQIVHALFVNIVLSKTLKRYTICPFWGLFLYFIYSFFLFNFEILREAIAISVFAIGLKYCINTEIKHHWLKYILCAVVAFLIHDSAIVLFIVPFVYGRRVTAVFLMACVALGIVFLVYWESLFTWLFSTGLIPMNLVTHALGYLDGNEGFSNRAIFYYSAIHLVFPLFVYYLGKKAHVETPVDGFLLYYIIVGILASFIPAMYRLANYQIILSIIYFSNFIVKVTAKEEKTQLLGLGKLVVALLFAVVFTYRIGLYQFQDYSQFRSGTKKYVLWTPYYSVFNPQKYPPREELIENMFYYY